jgi:hypothetical protein
MTSGKLQEIGSAILGHRNKTEHRMMPLPAIGIQHLASLRAVAWTDR